MPQVRTRFAPSPTGYLHIGGARTALFSYLYARHCGGKFVLRIEDTDRQRSTPEAIDAILESMEWLKLEWDEGPFYQTERMDLYRERIQTLLSAGDAYPCVCTPETLNAKREAALAEKRKPMYDGTCRPAERRAMPLPESVPYTIRFRSPESGATVVDDKVKGPVEFDNTELDDLILARSDGSPTYNFCVVCDDVDMGITHIIRGDDHLSNTPRQMQLYHALGSEPPVFAHVPLILGEDKKRLSKRHGATSVTAYRDMGYYPEALNNYLVRLGWSHGDQEIFGRRGAGGEVRRRRRRRVLGGLQPREAALAQRPLPQEPPGVPTGRGRGPLPFGQGLCRARRPRVAGEDGRDPEGTGQVPGRAGGHGALLPHGNGRDRREGRPQAPHSRGQEPSPGGFRQAGGTWPTSTRPASSRCSATSSRSARSSWAGWPSRCAWR